MKARDLMTSQVVTVSPDTPTRVIAKLLLDNRISAVPVVDDRGAPIGMVSEGDLIGRAESDRQARGDWWLSLAADGDPPDPAGLEDNGRRARDVMAEPVIIVGEETDTVEIARLLTSYRIKRVPVTRDGRIVGIVSRADLLRALAAQQPAAAAPRHEGLLARALAGLDEHFLHRRHDGPTTASPSHREDGGPTVTDFRHLVAGFRERETQRRAEARIAAIEQQQKQVAQLIDRHISDESWRHLLHKAREAAQTGQKELLMLRFPNQLCSDGGRAINANEPDWPSTLRGEAAELYLRWERDLKSQGFHLAAEVLEFPGGLPGDIGLFLVWGE